MAHVQAEIRGLTPLLMHAPRGVDPTDPLVRQMKEITSKGSKKKTEADLAQQDWLEFQLALYHDDHHGVYVPDRCILGVIQSGAKRKRKGREIQAGVEVEAEINPLTYPGPTDPRGLYDARYTDRRPVAVQRARVMRVRPRFNTWALAFGLVVDDQIIDPSNVRVALEQGGLSDGLLDGRPRFGRFEVVSWKVAA